ncbi:hypothetical protein JRO89_XS15G0012100 [Xanthoceras sorbifolium]|uniref:Uncharacterized protein n=1 Tax=Xanthoceras sorbifolium TaxID=99658 RepID=A0ABQ8H0N8_9ROSI|nr:hypothetical protein JRO89_XS15G0012100 [Xanthoceras sorbifolium]
MMRLQGPVSKRAAATAYFGMKARSNRGLSVLPQPSSCHHHFRCKVAAGLDSIDWHTHSWVTVVYSGAPTSAFKSEKQFSEAAYSYGRGTAHRYRGEAAEEWTLKIWLDELQDMTQRTELGLVQIAGGRSDSSWQRRPPTTSLQTELAVYGRDQNKAKILEMVLEG